MGGSDGSGVTASATTVPGTSRRRGRVQGAWAGDAAVKTSKRGPNSSRGDGSGGGGAMVNNSGSGGSGGSRVVELPMPPALRRKISDEARALLHAAHAATSETPATHGRRSGDAAAEAAAGPARPTQSWEGARGGGAGNQSEGLGSTGNGIREGACNQARLMKFLPFLEIPRDEEDWRFTQSLR